MAPRGRVLPAALFVYLVGVAPASANTTVEMQAPARLLFLGTDNYAPYQYRDDQGDARGFNVELMRALARETGVDIDIRLVSTGDALERLEQGEGDLVAVGYTEQRARRLTMLLPLWRIRYVALSREPLARSPGSLAELRGETLAVPRRSVLFDALMALPDDRRPTIVGVETSLEGAELVLDGVVSMVGGNAIALRASPDADVFSGLHETEIWSVPYYLAAPPGREDLRALFFEAYARLQETGEFGSIVERTLLPYMAPAPAAGRIGLYVLAALGIVCVAFFGAVLWNRSLSTTVQRRTRELETHSSRLAFQARVLAQVSDAIVVVDESMRVTTWNAGAEELFGIPAVDALTRLSAEVFAPILPAEQRKKVRAIVSQAGFWKGETQIRRADGRRIHVSATVQALQDQHGQPAGRLVVVHDIDARKQSETDARVRAQQQAAAAALGQRALAGLDTEAVMRQACAMASEILAVPLAGIFESTLEGPLRAHSAVGWQGGELPVARDGHVESVLAGEDVVASSVVIIPGSDCSFGLFVVGSRSPRVFSIDDVNFLQALANVVGASLERSRVDVELRNTAALHRATLESTAEGVMSVDTDGRVTSYNQRLLEMLDVPAQRLEHESFQEIAAGLMPRIKNAEQAWEHFQRASSSTSAEVATVHLVDGRVIERHTCPQRVDGRMVGRVWSFRDVTQRVRAEEERMRLEGQLQQVQKLESLGVLAGGIAHDFNNLLVGVLGEASLALAEVGDDSALRARLQQIETTALRAAELTNQMLAYSGKGRFVVQAVDLSAIVREMSNLLHTAIGKNAQVELRMATHLPAVQADVAQLRQIVMNLLTNASDAIGTREGRIVVTTGRMRATRDYLARAYVASALDEGEYVYLEVQDDGCGMDAGTQRRIFDPFFTTKFTGRGLGLAAVLGIVRGHKGAIRIDSTPGQGTVFRVLFPAGGETQQVEAPRAGVTQAARPGARLLVVDDEPSVRSIAREALTRAGYAVDTAPDGADAVERIRVEPAAFDGVLMDMTMPRMGGIDAMRAIRTIAPAMPVVLTSGYTEDEAVHRYGSEGLSGFIQKPFRPALLVAKMNEALANSAPDSR